MTTYIHIDIPSPPKLPLHATKHKRSIIVQSLGKMCMKMPAQIIYLFRYSSFIPTECCLAWKVSSPLCFLLYVFSAVCPFFISSTVAFSRTESINNSLFFYSCDSVAAYQAGSPVLVFVPPTGSGWWKYIK